jgi:hypothetical protein
MKRKDNLRFIIVCFVMLSVTKLHDFHGKKGKAISLQAWTGPEVSRRLGLPDFKTIGT